MVFEYLDRVRSRAPEARKRFAFLGAVVVTSIVAIGWAFTLPARLASLRIEGDDMAGAAELSEIGGQLKEGKDGLSEIIREAQELPSYVPEEVREEYRVGLDMVEDQPGRSLFESTSTAQEVTETRGVLIETVPSASTTNSSETP